MFYLATRDAVDVGIDKCSRITDYNNRDTEFECKRGIGSTISSHNSIILSLLFPIALDVVSAHYSSTPIQSSVMSLISTCIHTRVASGIVAER